MPRCRLRWHPGLLTWILTSPIETASLGGFCFVGAVGEAVFQRLYAVRDSTVAGLPLSMRGFDGLARRAGFSRKGDW